MHPMEPRKALPMVVTSGPGDPRNSGTQVAIVPITYVAIPLSDTQERRDKTGKYVSEGGPPIVKPLLRRFKKLWEP